MMVMAPAACSGAEVRVAIANKNSGSAVIVYSLSQMKAIIPVQVRTEGNG
jgi:hypothetical protein